MDPNADPNDNPVDNEGEGEKDVDQIQEESESDSDDQEFLEPEHRLMKRIQDALTKQLTESDEKLTLGLREKESSVSAVKGKREQIGVELYSYQQGLAKLQMQLEKTHDRYNVFFQNRSNAEDDLTKGSTKFKNAQEERFLLDKKRNKTQKELDKLKVTVNQIDEFNGKVKSEILVTRRAAYGTEQTMQKLEKDKQRQDNLIDSLNEQLKQANHQLRIYQGQCAAQLEETNTAKDALSEATREMELIAVEKRDYLQKWKTSLIGMANRDNSLKMAETALMEERETLANLENSIKGYRMSVKKEQQDNEKHTNMLNRTENEIRFVDQQLQQLAERKKELSDEYNMLRKTLETTDGKLNEERQTQRDVKSDIQNIHKNFENLTQEKQKLDDTIMENLSNQTTIEKGAQNVWKTTQKLKEQIHEKEIKMGEIQNEVARIKVDSLNTNAHNKELKQTLTAYDKELKEKDKLIEKYELEIRQRHDKIEKKQIYIARLNRKFEQLMSSQQDENTGPLEATIKNLNKEITQLNRETGELQREWIKSQTELVELVSDTNGKLEEVQEQKSRQTILSQKRLRLNNTYSTHLREIKEIQKNIKAMHNDMAKLNDLISKNTKLQSDLSNSTYIMETDFMNKLKELEIDSVAKDQNVEGLKLEKEEIFNEIVEIEKQIMLWEKKISLEKETQEALDPEYGQPEIRGMKKEIHRMRLRLSQLTRQQEKMIQEMERTIEKREHIKLSVANSNSSSSNKGQKQYTQASLTKKIVNLKQTLKTNVSEAKTIGESIARQEEHNSSLLTELEKHQRVYSEVEDKKHQILEKTNDAYFRKQMNLERILMYRKRGQRYADASEDKLKVGASTDRLNMDIERVDDKFTKIQDAIDQLKGEHPKHQKFFQRLHSFAS